MELVVSLVALLVAVVALGLVLGLRNQIAQLPVANSGGDLGRLRQDLLDVRSDLDRTQRELEQLKAATDIVPAAPPLPRARSAGLTDLREQLRAAHREPDADTDA
jgi:hypothetical protein